MEEHSADLSSTSPLSSLSPTTTSTSIGMVLNSGASSSSSSSSRRNGSGSSSSSATGSDTGMEMGSNGSKEEMHEDGVNVSGLDVKESEVMVSIRCSSDGDRTVRTSLLAARQCEMLAGALEDERAIEDGVDLAHIDHETATSLLSWCSHHLDHPVWGVLSTPLKSTRMSDLFPAWDAQFIDSLTLDRLMRLLCAANYLHVPKLLELCLAKTASIMQYKTPPQIRSAFGIRDLTAAERAEIEAKFPSLRE